MLRATVRFSVTISYRNVCMNVCMNMKIIYFKYKNSIRYWESSVQFHHFTKIAKFRCDLLRVESQRGEKIGSGQEPFIGLIVRAVTLVSSLSNLSPSYFQPQIIVLQPRGEFTLVVIALAFDDFYWLRLILIQTSVVSITSKGYTDFLLSFFLFLRQINRTVEFI